MTDSKKSLLVTCALPYANGPLHFGHILEHTQADIWVRFQRLQGHQCTFVCAADTHGTPIMVAAQQKNIKPEELVANARQSHIEDFKKFQISHDIYSSTHTAATKELCETFYHRMKQKNLIKTASIQQLFCEHDRMFLPDRFVKGTCPKCGAKDQYGDNCEKCSATYSPNDLQSPYCVVCKNAPITKSSEQIFFHVNAYRDFLQDWLKNHTAKEVCNKMLEWFKDELRDWDISRNAPYFGFLIPGYTDKYFYVWLDAPIGYMSATKELSESLYKNFWESSDPQHEVYHFIGKDIIYFHTLFWPALLKAADFRTPTAVFTHGFLTLNGEKMSKSKGTGLNVSSYLKFLDSDYLRYYLALKLGPGMDDIDFNLEDFVLKVNADLVGKITNLASRGAQMLGKNFRSMIVAPDQEGLALLEKIQSAQGSIAEHYKTRNFHKALAEIKQLADEANKYFDEKAPWKTLASDPASTQIVLSNTLNAFRLIAIYLKPVVPAFASRVEQLFEVKPFVWNDLFKTLSQHTIKNYEHLMTRIDPEKVKAMVEDSKNPVASSQKPEPTNNTAVLDIETFAKVDLRVAEVLEAEEIKEADKLIRLKVSLGDLGERQIIAGIKSAYKAETLKGRKILVVANLAPRKMKFGVSEGMVLAAGNESGLFVLSPDQGAKAGDKVK